MSPASTMGRHPADISAARLPFVTSRTRPRSGRRSSRPPTTTTVTLQMAAEAAVYVTRFNQVTVALLALAEMPVRLFGQMVAWSYGHFADRSGSEKLTQQG